MNSKTISPDEQRLPRAMRGRGRRFPASAVPAFLSFALLFFGWGGGALAAGGQEDALADEGDGQQSPPAPKFDSFRAIQYRYSELNCMVTLDWIVSGGHFSRYLFSVDGAPPRELAVDLDGIRVDWLRPGLHDYSLEGFWSGGSVMASLTHEALVESQVLAVIPSSCVFFGFDLAAKTGYLQVSFLAPDRPVDDPYLEFEFDLDGKFAHRSAASDNSVTFSGVKEGSHRVDIHAVTAAYTSPPATVVCRGVGVPAPEDVKLALEPCEQGRGAGTVNYRVPLGAAYDSVAVWVTSEEDREFIGWFSPSPPRIRLSGLPERLVEVEIAGARFDSPSDGGAEPYSISGLPDRPGGHAVAQAFVNCQGGAEFRRGDATADGRVNISDSIGILRHLFYGDRPLGCLDAGDIDDDGNVNLTDPVLLLGYLFASGSAPVSPGPSVCGEDATPSNLTACSYDACVAMSPVPSNGGTSGSSSGHSPVDLPPSVPGTD